MKKEIRFSDLVKLSKKGKSVRKPGTVQRPAGGQPKGRRAKKEEIVGLKIGASQIAASRVMNNGSSIPKLVQLARQPLAPGVVVGGEVRDVPALARALDSFFKTEKLPRRGVRLGIGTNRVGVRALDVDGVEDERQLENAVRFRAHDAMSIPMDQAVLSYHVLSETVDESGAVSWRVLLAAAYREPIDHYIEACRAAGIELAGIDVEAFALLRAVAPDRAVGTDGDPVAVVALSLGHDRSTLAISDGVVCDFVRVLEWGGAKLETAIARELSLTSEEAAELKLAVSLEAPEGPSDDPIVSRARQAVLRELQALGRELIASLQFYQSQPGSLAISEILLTGGTTRLPGLAEELERIIRVKVHAADPLLGVQSTGVVSDRADLASLAVAIGLGVGH